MRVYIAGPMGHYKEEEYNRASFAFAWNYLTKAGIHAVSPHFLESAIEIETRAKMGPGDVYRYALPIDCFAISAVDACVALPGWDTLSDGSVWEAGTAKMMHCPWVSSDVECEPGPGGTVPLKHSTITLKAPLADYLDDCIDQLKDIALCRSS